MFRPALRAVPALLALALLAPPGASAAPIHHVRIHAVLTAEDDGTFKATATGAQIAAAVEHANETWDGAGLVFDFDPATDIETRNSALLRGDCTPTLDPAAPDACDEAPNVEERERVALDDAHDGKITVYFRSGASGAHSSRAAHYVVMGGGDPGRTLAHELGHYLWNSHTFGPTPATLEEAAERIKDYVEGTDGYSSHPKGEGLNVFDGDRNNGDATDTPPDPGAGLWEAIKGDKCAPAPDGATHPLTVTFSDNSEKTYTLAPDRSNVMSYFNSCFRARTSSPEQKLRAHIAVEQWNRTQLSGQTPTFFDPELRWSGTTATGVTSVVPFMSLNRPHLLHYDKATGAARIDWIRSEPDAGPETVWTGLFQTGWTSIVPFELNGVPHVLLYKSTDGTAKIAKLKGSQGVDVIWTGLFQTGWTHLTATTLSGKPHVLLYKSGDGNAKIAKILGAQGVDGVWTGLFQTGWTHVTAINLNGGPHVLLYKGDDGKAKIAKILGAQGVDGVWTGLYQPGWTSFVTFDRGSQTRLQVYNAATGKTKAVRLTAGGGVETMWQGTWGTGYTVVRMRLIGHWYAYAYDPGSGQTRIVRFIQ
jgi:hypothetical protein